MGRKSYHGNRNLLRADSNDRPQAVIFRSRHSRLRLLEDDTDQHVPFLALPYRDAITLEPGQTLERRLNDSGGPFTISGNAIPFSKITTKEANAQFLTAGTMADADGNYRIAGLWPGGYRLMMRDKSWWGSPANVAGAQVSLHSDRSHDFTTVFSTDY